MEENKKKIIVGGIIAIVAIIIILLVLKGCDKEYKITFNTDGGSNVASLVVKKDGTIKKPEDPTKEGYSFAGWYYNDKLFDFNTKITEDMILEARWTLLDASVTGVTLDVNEMSLVIDQTATLSATVLPENAKNKNITWSSNNKNVVTVDENGHIKALKKGTATITVTTEDGKFTATCKITVTESVVSVSNVKLSGASSVKVGNTIKLTATITPSNATNKKLTWTSSDPKKANVDENGNVKGISEGSVTITVTTEDNNKTATHRVTIVKNETTPSTPTNPSNPSKPSNPDTPTNPSTPSTPTVKEIIINGPKTVEAGSTIKLTATIKMSDNTTTTKTITWTSSNSDIATVNDDGVVTGKKAGSVEIIAKVDNITASYDITVNAKVEPPKEISYVITLTRLQDSFGNVNQYEITSVTADGENFDFKAFTYNGQTRLPSHINSTLNKKVVDENIKTATIVLNDGTSVEATVVYKVREI